jgi:hypothetical protein
MADYGLNFGFRRTGGDSATREGRYRVPATGVFHQGDLVTIDAAAPGFIKLAPAGTGFQSGITGLLVQEFELYSVYTGAELDSHMRGVAKNGYLATIWSGAGEKIWIRNTPAQSRWDGRQIAARNVIVATGVAVLDTLQWDGTKWIKTPAVAPGTAGLKVTVTDSSTYAEAVLLS